MQASIQRTPSTIPVRQFDRTSLIESSETYVVSRRVVETSRNDTPAVVDPALCKAQ